MFVVQPYDRLQRIRSSLGFMSLATRWGQHLFPGITVLTRDVRDLKAMHDTALEMRAAPGNLRALSEFQSQRADRRIAANLEAHLYRQGISEPKASLRQQTSYWIRYGSTFEYFDMYSVRRSRSPAFIRDMIFNPSPALASNQKREDAAARRRRIKHFLWYQRFRYNLDSIESADRAQRLLRGSNSRNALRLWWLTGKNPPDATPPAIKLVRELEFSLVILQVMFESAAILAIRGQLSERMLARRNRSNASAIELVSALATARQTLETESIEHLLLVAIKCHERYIADGMKLWVKSVEAQMPGASPPLVRLHGDLNIGEFVASDVPALLRNLADLHVAYCYQQKKPHAIIAKRFFPVSDLGSQWPELTPGFGSTRWGLHGYRFEAAVALEASRKYEGQDA